MYATGYHDGLDGLTYILGTNLLAKRISHALFVGLLPRASVPRLC